MSIYIQNTECDRDDCPFLYFYGKLHPDKVNNIDFEELAPRCPCRRSDEKISLTLHYGDICSARSFSRFEYDS
jgi:hypothetical protein